MGDFLKLFFGLLIVVIVIAFTVLVFEKFITEETVEIKVIKTEKLTTKSGEEYFLIYTKNEIFEDRNNYFHGKNNAKELASKLKVGKKYRVKVVGFNFGVKIPLFLEHRNIIQILNSKTVIVN